MFVDFIQKLIILNAESGNYKIYVETDFHVRF
jgi:hypothetical protein